MSARDFKREGQGAKATAITALVDDLCALLKRDGTADAEHVLGFLRGLDDAWWLRLQQATGNPRKEPPSQDVRNMVLKRFEARVISAARFEEPESEPDEMNSDADGDYYLAMRDH